MPISLFLGLPGPRFKESSLMPTARKGYFTKNGTKVPSVTTILGRFKESGGLIWWAWDLGRQGKDYRAEKDIAAEAGTLAHAAIDAYIHKQPFEWRGTPEIQAKAISAYEAFLEWSRQTNMVCEETELPLVSEKYQYGGTFDSILVKGKRAMGDWKSSNAIYPEYLCQLAAYGNLWNENYPDRPIAGGYHLLRFDKTYADFHHHYWAELDTAWKAFLLLRQLYEYDKELKARVK
jgi:hypothetical protein